MKALVVYESMFGSTRTVAETIGAALSQRGSVRVVNYSILGREIAFDAVTERNYFGDERFDDIARSLGVSKSWASRLHAQAMRALAERLRDHV